MWGKTLYQIVESFNSNNSVKDTLFRACETFRVIIPGRRGAQFHQGQRMRILEYNGLETSGVTTAYRKVTAAIECGDFHAAQVKKLASISHGKFYRARLDGADRLLFSLVRYQDEVCALMLEVILNHNYDKSRFLRGAIIDEDKLCAMDATSARQEAEPLRYLHPDRTVVHLLDKPISFDDAQDAVYREAPPLIVVGSAGSGKTALTLEKLKHAEGEVLYVTHSAFLARNARDLYYANGFEHTGQDAVFLSYREFVESIRVPGGREAQWRDFAAWFARLRQTFKGIDAHQAFEEIRGVLAAGAEGVVSRAAYQQLGVRQSIFPADRRDVLYDLFDKYRAWLAGEKLYDLNLVAQDWLSLAAARYDFVVIDEVQDITAIQLALVLKTLRRPGHFLLCGDSNQIVHPNFFSWAQVKSLFWCNAELAERQTLKMLDANFRNGAEATRVANTLLKIKQKRFGSIDRESNFLVRAVGGESGQVVLLPDRDDVKKELDGKIRKSTQFAVLVMRDEDKARAREYFTTPLLFAIHEVKGLEYENIVLYRYVSDHRAEYAEIAAGVAPEDLAADALDYRRARDKDDKSLEVYKFFVNALYVALTRATRNIYLIESDGGHPILQLLALAPADRMQVEARQSSHEDWQREARKLELQGKQEQAEAIRKSILREAPVPWPVFDQARIEALLNKVFREQVPGSKPRQQLYEYAACHDEPVLVSWLVQEAKFDTARGFEQQRASLVRKFFAPYFANNFKDILRQCSQHGLEHRLPMNLTPLMAAAAAGNLALVESLLERGANRDATDHLGCNALHWALRAAIRDRSFARGPFAALYELLAPAAIDFTSGQRLIRVDRHLSEYFLLQTLWALFKSRFTHQQHRPLGAFDTASILAAWEHLPANVVRPERNRRQHLSGVLARNEVGRDYAYNRALFKRVRQGWYQFNPALLVRPWAHESDTWVPVYQALNLPFINEFARDDVWHRIAEYLAMADLPGCATPIAAERAQARIETARREQAELAARRQRERERWLAMERRPLPGQPEEPKWGTAEAKRREI